MYESFLYITWTVLATWLSQLSFKSKCYFLLEALPGQSTHPSLFPSSWCILRIDDVDFFRLERHAILFTIFLFMSLPAGEFLHVKTIHCSPLHVPATYEGLHNISCLLIEWMNEWPMGKTKLRICKSLVWISKYFSQYIEEEMEGRDCPI